MNTHEFAKMLLSLPDKPFTVIYGVDGQYTKTGMLSPPWDTELGDVRTQVVEEDYFLKSKS